MKLETYQRYLIAIASMAAIIVCTMFAPSAVTIITPMAVALNALATGKEASPKE